MNPRGLQRRTHLAALASTVAALLCSGLASLALAQSQRPRRLTVPVAAARVCSLPRRPLPAREGGQPGVVYTTVLAARARVRVLELAFVPPIESAATETNEIWGCWGHRRGVLLNESFPGKSAAERLDTRTLELAGDLAAFAHYERPASYNEEEVLPHPHSIYVVNLRTRRVERVLEDGIQLLGGTTSLVLKADGAVAVINQAPTALSSRAQSFEVDAYDRVGPPRLLASGSDIAPRSLRLQGSTLTWRQRGHQSAAVLR